MKRIAVCVLLSFFFSTAAMAAFPSLPGDVVPIRVDDFGAITDVYLWSVSGKIYVRLVPIVAGDLWCHNHFEPVIQDGKQYDSFIYLYKEDGGTFCDNLYVPVTLELACSKYSESCFDANRTLTVVIIKDPVNYVELTPRTPQAIYPTPGIWKSGDGVLSMYLQKYKTGSCIVVVTMGDGILTAFMDTNYKDGINGSDVYGQGYILSLTLTDSTHGTVTVTLPGYGQITTPVALSFEYDN